MMCNLLVVEDNEELCKQIVSMLLEEFADGRIDAGISVEEGLQFIRHGSGYDIAILDFKLPLRAGEHDCVDGRVCQALRDTCPTALVIHITGHPDESDIQRHMAQSHVAVQDTRSVLISKLERRWPDEVLRRVKSFHYGGSILFQMRQLFRQDDREFASNTRASVRSSSSLDRNTTFYGGHSATHALAALMRDIIVHWADLDEGQRAQVQQNFEVVDNRKSICVSLR